MKIATINVGNINRRLLLDWLKPQSLTSVACRISNALTLSFRRRRSSAPAISPYGAGLRLISC
jgi:hypothetical protein